MKKYIAKYKYEIMAAVVFLMYLMYYIPPVSGVIDWCITPYALSYRLGFISRGFIGSLVRLVFPSLTLKHIYIIIFVNIILLCGLTLYFMHKIITGAYDESRIGLMFLMAVFVLNPGSIAFLFGWENYGRFDMYLLMCLLICSLLIIYNVGTFIIPVLCVCAVLTHQAFVFQYFPAILILLFYSAFILKRRNQKAVFAVTLILTCVMFLYAQFFAQIRYTYEETLAIIDTTTDLPRSYFTDDMMVKIEYYSSVFETFVVFVKETFVRNVIKSLSILVFMIPMIKVIADIWKEFVRAHKGLICRLLPWGVLLAEIPMFVLTCDYGRDYAAIVLCNFILIFALYAMGDEGIKTGIQKLSVSIRNDIPYYVFVCGLVAAVGKFTASDICDIGNNIYKIIESVLF